jgi:hypothetical protein
MGNKKNGELSLISVEMSFMKSAVGAYKNEEIIMEVQVSQMTEFTAF